jgi:methionine aminotransferase
MSKMAAEYNAINLSQGFPNFPVDERLTDILAKLSRDNVHQYTPMAGYPPLMIQIAKLVFDSYKRTINPDLEVLVTAGATQGIFTTILAGKNR